MKDFILICVIIFIGATALAQDLPRYLTDAEKELIKTYVHPVYNFGSTTPPSKPVRTMAEWEELDGIIITWTSYQIILRQIVDYAQEEGKVYIVCSDSNSVKSYLTSGGVPLTNLKFLIAPFNSVWVRDYGPWCVYSDIIDSLYLVDWIYNRPRPLDDVIPGLFAANQNIPLYQMTQAPYNFTATGGNFMTDALGKGFSSKLILIENPTKTEAQIDTMMRMFMGINPYIKMDNLPYDGIHHIDMHMKLLDEETLLVGQYPLGVSDGPQIELNLQYILNNFQTCYGRPFKVVRILMPPDAQGRYPNTGGDYRTYTNSVIVNKTVIVPTYAPQYDTTALRIYKEAMPGYNVVGINSNQMITALGAIHCITKEIGVREPILISHPKIRTTASFTNAYEVKSFIKTRSGVASAEVYWSIDTTQGFTSIPMVENAPDTFVANIPLQSLNTKVFYYISALSNSNKTITKPLTSPKGAYQFIVDTVVPVELVSFTADISGSNIILNWSTVTEINNNGFEIQRKVAESEFATVGFVRGSGTTANKKVYSYIDKNLVDGKYFYRLKQIDFNGSYKYSNVIEINLRTLNDYSLERNFPNPFNPITTIGYVLKEKSNAKLIVLNAIGEEIAVLVNEEQNKGFHKIEFNAADLPSGVYFYQLRAFDPESNSGQGFVQTRKMILLK